MSIEINYADLRPDVCVARLQGRLDVHYSSEAEAEIMQLIEQGVRKLLIDLEQVEYISSSGLRIFIALSRKLKETDGELKLMKLNETALKIFRIVELIDMFDIYDSEAEAVRAFS